MRIPNIQSRTRLVTFLISIAAMLFLVIPMSRQAAVTPQGKGGEVVAKPTPTPKKTTTKRNTPSKTTNNSKTNQATKSASEAATAAEMIFWNSIKDSTNPEDFKEYLKKYPDGEFAGLANNRLKNLEDAKAKPKPSPNSESERKASSFVPPKPGTVIRNQSGIEMVWIAPGEFMMGLEPSNMSTAYENGEALPQHRVAFRNGFYLGEYEVTQGQWQAVMAANVRQQRDKAGPSEKLLAEGDGYPMYYVSWDDAQEFIRKLNQLNDGYTYRLPTEAEWEYACRAGTTTRYSFGDFLSADNTNFDSNSNYPRDEKKVWRRDVTLAGSFQPNAFGLYDMHGNVWEWCQDWYDANYYKESTHYDPPGPRSGQEREARGGSWANNFDYTRSSSRHGHFIPTTRNNTLGFRIVMVPKI